MNSDSDGSINSSESTSIDDITNDRSSNNSTNDSGVNNQEQISEDIEITGSTKSRDDDTELIEFL